MQTLTYTHFRSHLAQMMDNVTENHTPLLITRGSASPVVLLSLEDYHSFIETMHLMSSTSNSKCLNRAINDLRAGKGTQKKLIED